jgi:selenocysteine lyase/cysteine desulfurase
MFAAGLMPLQIGTIGPGQTQVRDGRGGRAPNSPPVNLGPAPRLPDKASFAHIQDTYLNSAATHPSSAGATALVKKALLAEAGDSDGFRPSEDRVRENFAKLINADADEIAFVPSTQVGESFIAAALGLPGKGAHVVSDVLHFVGSQMMYTDMSKRGLDVTWVKMKDGRIPPEDVDKAIIKGKTRLVAISATSFVNGFQHDLKQVSEIAHAKGAMVYADIIQAAGNVPLDVKDCGVDAACCATYKWLMASGTAFLYIRRSSQARMQPPFYHFSQMTTPLPATHMYPFDAPGKDIVDGYAAKKGAAGMFSMGYTNNPAVLAGLEYSLPYIMNVGVKNIQAHAKPMTDRLKLELPKRGYPLLTPVDSMSPIVTCVAKAAERLAPAFNAANVRVTTRWNHIRIGISVFNDMEDVERFLAALPKAV